MTSEKWKNTLGCPNLDKDLLFFFFFPICYRSSFQTSNCLLCAECGKHKDYHDFKELSASEVTGHLENNSQIAERLLLSDQGVLQLALKLPSSVPPKDHSVGLSGF